MWRGLDAFEAATGTVIPERGPYDPENDPLWQRRIAGEIGFYDYWETVAQRAGFPGWRALYREVSGVVPESLVVPEAVALMRAGEASGQAGGRALERRVLDQRSRVLRGATRVPRSRRVRRLDRRRRAQARARALPRRREGISASSRLPSCSSTTHPSASKVPASSGCSASTSIRWHRRPAFERCGRGAGPRRPSRAARRLVARGGGGVRAPTTSMRSWRCSIPTRSSTGTARRWRVGPDEMRRFHVERLGFGEDRQRDDRVTKTLRAAQGDTVAVEWTSSTRSGADLLTLRGDLIVEWHAYSGR